jgi:hypothetical protein
MEYSLPAWLGALVGAVVAVALYVPAIRIVDRHLRAQGAPAAAEQREDFESRIALVRRSILGIDIAILATLGYWAGKALGSLGGAPALH